MVPNDLLGPKISISTSRADRILMATRIPKPSNAANGPRPRRHNRLVLSSPILRLSPLRMAKLRPITMINLSGQSAAELEWREFRNKALQDWIPLSQALILEVPRISEIEKIGREPVSRESTRERVQPSTYLTFPPYTQSSKVGNSLSSKIKSCFFSVISTLGSGVRAINKFYGTSLRKWDDEYHIPGDEIKISGAERRKEMDADSARIAEKEPNVPRESPLQGLPPQSQGQRKPCALKRWTWKSSTKRKNNPEPNQHAKKDSISATSAVPSTQTAPRPAPHEQAQIPNLPQITRTSTATKAPRPVSSPRPHEADYFSPSALHARTAQGRRQRRIVALEMPRKEFANSDRSADVLERRFVSLDGALDGHGAGFRRGSVDVVAGVVGVDASSSEEEERPRGGAVGVRGGVEMVEREDLGTPWSALETVFEDLDEGRDGGGHSEGDCGGFESCTGELCLRRGVCVTEAMACMAP